ncbi:MAG: potassium-tellurite ethidium and proflavin transporter [Pseudonocardiales bacterium]|nr:potassium-tellurite ethidium and proflavin transporter [Pseudonocardiales bacterium]
MLTYRIPLNLFAVGFGISGLAETWRTAAAAGSVPQWIGDGILALGAVAWAGTLTLYVAWAARHRVLARADLVGPVTAPLASLVLITPLVLAAQGIAPHAHAVGVVVIDVLIALVVAYGAWFTGQLIDREYHFDQLHPGYFLPTVAGRLIASAAAAEAGQHRLGEVLFGYGITCWFILGSMILARLFFRPSLPAAVTPTIAIEVAPAAVASLAHFALAGPHLDSTVSWLAGYGVLMCLTQLRLLARFRRLTFSVGFWSFTFGWAAVATTTLHWIEQTQPPGQALWTAIVLAAISTLVVGIAVRTVLAIARHQLLPQTLAIAATTNTPSAAVTGTSNQL